MFLRTLFIFAKRNRGDNCNNCELQKRVHYKVRHTESFQQLKGTPIFLKYSTIMLKKQIQELTKKVVWNETIQQYIAVDVVYLHFYCYIFLQDTHCLLNFSGWCLLILAQILQLGQVEMLEILIQTYVSTNWRFQ